MKSYNRDDVMAYMESIYTAYLDTSINEINCNKLAKDAMCKFTGITAEEFESIDNFKDGWEFFSMALDIETLHCH